jgi:hypothetical protein
MATSQELAAIRKFSVFKLSPCCITCHIEAFFKPYQFLPDISDLFLTTVRFDFGEFAQSMDNS